MNRLLLASAQQQLGMGRSGDRCCLVVMTASPLFDFPQQKEERENGVNTNTNCRCFCVDQASFLSPCYFLFFAVGCGFSRPGVDEKCVNPITSP